MRFLDVIIDSPRSPGQSLGHTCDENALEIRASKAGGKAPTTAQIWKIEVLNAQHSNAAERLHSPPRHVSRDRCADDRLLALLGKFDPNQNKHFHWSLIF